MKHLLTAAALSLALAACDEHPATPGQSVIYRDVLKEVPRPCPVTAPTRPAALARPLPTDPGALVSLLAGKLKEWSGEGGYAERAEAAIQICTRP
jgi:hypothetical protein